MLVLTRQEGQKVMIRAGGEVITVCVVQLRGDKVRLGFEASQYVRIDREEVYLRREDEETVA